MCRNWKLPGLAHLCSKGAHEPNSSSLTPPYPPPRPELPIYCATGLVRHPPLRLLVPLPISTTSTLILLVLPVRRCPPPVNALRKDCHRPLCFGAPRPLPALCLVARDVVLLCSSQPPAPALAVCSDLSQWCSPAWPDSATQDFP